MGEKHFHGSYSIALGTCNYDEVDKGTPALNGVTVSTSSASVFEEFSGIRAILAALSPEKPFPGCSVLGGLNQQAVIVLCPLELLKVSRLQRQSDLQLSYSL